MKVTNILLASFIACTAAHSHSSEDKEYQPQDFGHTESKQKEPPTLEQLWGADWPFGGINTFAHLPHTKCLLEPELKYDIAIIGMPFDTAVSYRPGARFGPRGIRAASQRQTSLRGYNFRAGINPYDNWAKIIDCGDMPISPMDNNLALRQMSLGYDTLLNHSVANKEYHDVPRLISLGGDHSIILPALRALRKKHGEITLIHFDSHLDTWSPDKYVSGWESNQDEFTHGSMLWMAWREGLLSSDKNFHVGLRTRLSSVGDYHDDDKQGFTRILADDIFTLGIDGIVKQILNTIPKNDPVYISFDIDVIDPGQAPGTGTPEVGGLLTREVIQLIRRLENLNIVGADIVEVSPGYDHAEITSLAASQVAYEILTNIVKKGPLHIGEKPKDSKIAALLNQANEVAENFVNW